MKLRLTCKCGAEFEATGLAGNVGRVVDGWRELHTIVCYDVDRIHKEDGGDYSIRPSPNTAAERLNQNSEQRGDTAHNPADSAPISRNPRSESGPVE